jgi:hypothetical protein
MNLLLAFVFSLLPHFVWCDSVEIDGHRFNVNELRVDPPRPDVQEIPNYAATFFSFSMYHDNGVRRKPVVGIRLSDVSFRYTDENKLMDPAESSYNITLVQGHVQQRYVAILLDLSDSIFSDANRPELMTQTTTALFQALDSANLPGVVVAVYAFADVDSIRLVHDYTSDMKEVQSAISREMTLSAEDRLAKYGRATNLFGSIFTFLELVEQTLKDSKARTRMANVFVFTDGNDDTRIISAEAASTRLKRAYGSWSQDGLDITVQPVFLSGLDQQASLEKLNFNERIDGSSLRDAEKAFDGIATDMEQNTPASYSVVVCETARDTAPRQRRDLLLQGHRILSYDFNPTGFKREGAAKCDAHGLLEKMVQQAQDDAEEYFTQNYSREPYFEAPPGRHQATTTKQ